MKSKWKIAASSMLLLMVGTLLGGYLFSGSQPRSVLALNSCQDCMNQKDLAGLMASVGILRAPGMLPFVVFETDKSVAFKIPAARGHFHYIIVPKKDIKDIGDISQEDAPYFSDACLVARHIIQKEKLSSYMFFTNGPGLQKVTYLHFHLADGI